MINLLTPMRLTKGPEYGALTLDEFIYKNYLVTEFLFDGTLYFIVKELKKKF